MIVYKVVGEDGYSCAVDLETLRVFYQIGEIITPKLEGTPLFAFVNSDSAKIFVGGTDNRILECEVDDDDIFLYGEVLARLNTVDLTDVNSREIVSFWKNNKPLPLLSSDEESISFILSKSFGTMRRALCPSGTILVKKLKVIEDITDEIIKKTDD